MQVPEIVVQTIQNKQDAMDWLTYTFFYRRLAQNPNYYNMHGKSHRHISEHLSELVESVTQSLHDAHAILVDGFNLSAENLGIIASYHHVSYRTLDTFNKVLKPKNKIKGLLHVLGHAVEFETLPVRPGEEQAIRRLVMHAKAAVETTTFADPKVKANALLQVSRTDFVFQINITFSGCFDPTNILCFILGINKVQAMHWLK